MPRTLKPCGTYAAYKRHIRRREQPCDACLEANHQLYLARRTEPYIRGPYAGGKCGTNGGYKAHLRRREVACTACCAALAEYQRAYRARRQAAEVGV